MVGSGEPDRSYSELAHRRHPPGSVKAGAGAVGVGGFRVVPEAAEFWQGRENRTARDRLRWRPAA